MAKANLKGALATEKIGSFGGICHGGSKNSTKKEKGFSDASDICNFRILPDGSLEKRSGFAPIMTLPDEPRAFWSGYLDGDELSFALIGSAVYSIDFSSETLTLLGNILSSVGKAEFFFCNGVLYLVDGEDFYRYDGEDFVTFSGYVPLYGKDWGQRYGNEIYEHINFLSDKIRIVYNLSEPSNYFYFGVKCKEILSVKRNGIEYVSDMTLSADGKSMKYSGGGMMPEGQDIFVCLRLDDSEYRRDELIGVTHGTVYGGSDDNRMLLWGGHNKSLIFTSKHVLRQSYLESLESDPASSEVYFPINQTVSVTDGRYPITALCRHYDRLLVFTERETWMADFTDGAHEADIVPINSSVGCLSEGGAVLGGNSPYSVSERGIYRWTSNSDERDECNAVCISGEINDMLDESFFDHAVCFYLRARNEVWFADPDSDEQQVFIYSISGEKWYRFDGIPVDSFFGYKGDVGMLYGKYIFAFSDLLRVDTACDGKTQSNIEAFYESNVDDFGHEECTKHLKRILVRAKCDGDEFDIVLRGDMGGERRIEISEREGDRGKYPTYLDARSDIGRFREMDFIVHSGGVGRTLVKSIKLVANK